MKEELWDWGGRLRINKPGMRNVWTLKLAGGSTELRRTAISFSATFRIQPTGYIHTPEDGLWEVVVNSGTKRRVETQTYCADRYGEGRRSSSQELEGGSSSVANYIDE